MLPEEFIRILDEKKTDEDWKKHQDTYNHLNAEATTLKGTS